MMSPKALWGLLREAYSGWQEDKAAGLAAALAYYTMFSIAPLLLIAIAIAGVVFGEAAVRGQIVDQIGGAVGPDSAKVIEQAIQGASKPDAGILATVIGVIMLLLGASGVFGQLRGALNTIWRVDPKAKRSILHMVKKQLASFLMVIGIGFLLLLSLVASSVVSALGGYLSGQLPIVGSLLPFIDFLVSFGIITLLFAAIYKVLPDTEIAWADVWLGAIFTALLFTVGKLLLGLYLGKASVGSAYGTAGGLLVILVWLYYSTQLLFLGAEFTRIYANKHGTRSQPEDRVDLANWGLLAQQGQRAEREEGAEADTAVANWRGNRVGGGTRAINRLIAMASMPLIAVTVTTGFGLALFRLRARRRPLYDRAT